MTTPTPPTATAATPFDRAHRALTFGMVALVGLVAFESLAVTTAMPAVADALHGDRLYALAFGAPLASGVVGMVAAGAWCDRRGPGAALRAGVALFVAGLLVAGLAPTMGVLVAGRLAQGLGSGAISVALYVVVAQVYDESLRPRVFAAFAGAWVVPAIVGPAIAGAAVETVGWRSVFLAVPALTVIAMRAVAPVLPRSSSPISAPPAEIGDQDDGVLRRRLGWALAAAAGAVALHGAGQRSDLAGIALVALAALVVAMSARALLPAGTGTARCGLAAVVALRGLVGAAFLGAEVFVPLVLTEQRGLPAAVAGLVITSGALTWFAGSWWQGRDVRFTPAARLRLGTALMTVGLIGVSTAAIRDVPIVVALVSWALTGLGIGMVYPTLSVRTLELSAPGEEGANSSALQLGEAMSAATALAVGGTLFTLLGGAERPAAYVACFAMAAALAATASWLAPRTAVVCDVAQPAGAMRRMRVATTQA